MPKAQIQYILYFLFLVVLMNSSAVAQDNLRERLFRKATDSHVQSANITGSESTDSRSYSTF